MTDRAISTPKPDLNPGLKIALDIGPLFLFFIANSRWGIFVATAAFMVAVVLALIVSYTLIRRLPVMTVLSAVIVLVFGGLTLILQDDLFIKLKPTIIYLLFGGVLAGGLMLGKPLLAMVLDTVFTLTDEGWRRLTIRWSIFFFALAALNEIVWRTQTTDFWVSFKVFGVIPLTMVFAALQYRLLARYDAKAVPAKSADQ
jgi:intracellular septation protein